MNEPQNKDGMKPELCDVLMKNNRNELLFVSYLAATPLDAWEKAEQYASQLNATIAKFDTIPIKDGKAITMADRLLRKGD